MKTVNTDTIKLIKNYVDLATTNKRDIVDKFNIELTDTNMELLRLYGVYEYSDDFLITANNLPVNQLKCIKVTHTNTSDKDFKRESYISFNQFTESFVYERWENERRTKKEYTMFGTVHTKTTIKNPYDPSHKSIRDFSFPSSREEAIALHIEND